MPRQGGAGRRCTAPRSDRRGVCSLGRDIGATLERGAAFSKAGTQTSALVDLRISKYAWVVLKGLWAAVQGDAVFMRRVNGWLTLGWIAMIPVSIATGWVKSVTYVSALS